MAKEKRFWTVKELVKNKEDIVEGKIRNVYGTFLITRAGAKFQNRKPDNPKGELWSRKYSLSDPIKKNSDFLTLTLFSKQEEGIFDNFDVGDTVDIGYALYERKEWNGVLYNNLTLGEYGKIEKKI